MRGNNLSEIVGENLSWFCFPEFAEAQVPSQ
jgi:hypothetical protein